MRDQAKAFLLLLGIVAISICQCRSRPLTAGIFGFGANERKNERPPPPPGGTLRPPMNRQPPDPRQENRTPPQSRDTPGKLPPPPPPPSASGTPQTTGKSETRGSYTDQGIRREDHAEGERAQPPAFWGAYNQYPYGGPGWMPPPDPSWVPPSNDWNQQQSFRPQQGEDLDDFQRIQHILDETLTRESELLGHVHNLTAAVTTFQQREDLHIRQLDVLTERVMDAEAQTASERNALLEYQANCTELGHALALLQDEVLEWESKCANLTAQHQSDEETIMEMMAEVKARNAEVERFATIVEKSRISDERDVYVAERLRKKKQRGFFAWLFGIGNDADEEEARLQELARSTLLRALQTERESVHELESVLSILQQNNSAISEMVESRDELIDELNDRVAVFEEDKLVLKAALRQLQKEMADEAPKTQKLIDDLRSAREQVDTLKHEVDSLLRTHQKEVSLFKEAIARKQVTINETESNLTVIGTYVDKLEERLASFAIARREIEIREERCNAIERRSAEVEEECALLQKHALEQTTEHNELKKLLEDLVSERSALKTENAQLQNEKIRLIDQGNTLQLTIATLENEILDLNAIIDEWKSKVSDLEATTSQQRYQLDEYAWQQSERDRIESEAVEQRKVEQACRDAELEEKRQSELKLMHQQELEQELEIFDEITPQQMTEKSEEVFDEVIRVDVTTSDSGAALEELSEVRPEPHDGHDNIAQIYAPEAVKSDEDEPTLPEQTDSCQPDLPPSQDATSAPVIPPPSTPSVRSLQNRRNVTLRRIRKSFSKVTGIHGMFTPPSSRHPPPPRSPSRGDSISIHERNNY